MQAIAALYSRLRYGAGDPELLDQLKRRLSSFHP